MPPGDDATPLESLSARVEALERRIAALETLRPARTPDQEPAGTAATATPGAGEAAPEPTQASVFPIFGRAIVGIAGAYLLRAASETGTLPAWMAVTLALGYAGGWLAWAARPTAQTQLARHCYALTAAMIYSPLLWEATVRFGILRPPLTATILAGFAALAMALAWGRNVTAVVWVGVVAAVITALTLMAGTRAPVPFAWALVAMAALSELAGGQGRWPALRVVAATATDLAAIVVILILGDARAVPAEYQAVGAGVLIALTASLWVLYALSVAVHSLILRRKISGFEAAQFAATALLASWAVMRATQGAGEPALGICWLVAGAACYFAAFGPLAGKAERGNFRFYAICGVAFVTAGSFFALPVAALVIWLSLAAVIATGLGVRVHGAALDLHGVVYVCGALAASGLAGYAGRALAGTFPPAPGALMMGATAAALLCAAMVSRYPGEHAGERLLRALPTILAVYATAGLAVAGLVWLVAGGATPGLPQLAVIRTVVTCAAALLLAFLGARLDHIELVWMAYAAAVLGSLKLVFEDLRFGSTQSVATSLLIYGAVLILIPRLVRARKGRA